MPNFNIYYYQIKPTPVPIREGASGTATGLMRGSEAGTAAPRRVVMGLYEQYTTQLFQNALPPGWTARVNRLQQRSGSPHPDFSGVSVHWREPIVYLVSDEAREYPASSTHPNRRASLILIRELQDGNYQEFSQSNLMDARRFVRRRTGADPGGIALMFGWAPLVAEAFTTARVPYDDVSTDSAGTQGWQRHQARHMANASFHEVAHLKAQWVNRPTGSAWSAAISGDIHDVAGVSVLAASVNHATSQSAADRQLMRSHILCPMPSYKLGVPAAQQCYQGSNPLVPTPA